MQRIDVPTAVGSLPTPAAAGTPGYWTDGDPATSTPATILDPDWLNMVQEELMAVVAAPGTITPDKSTRTQLRDAISALIAAGAATYSGAVVSASSNLKASATGSSATVLVSFDELALENASNNQYKTLRAGSISINTAGSAGANSIDTGVLATNTFYSIWVIWNGTTTAGLISLSATAPTMPSGYTHKARVGYILTDGTANKYPLSFIKAGKKVRYKLAGNVSAYPIMGTGNVGNTSTPTLVAVSVAVFVPPTATVITVIGSGGAYGSSFIIAANANVGPIGSLTNPPPISGNNGAASFYTQGTVQGDLMLESGNIYWASTSSAMFCAGYEDSV